MTIFKQEIKSQKLAIIIWSLSIGLLIAMCVFMYPDMKSEMDDVNEIFSSMGNFTSAFGMDQLNFGTLIGFYAVEAGNILGIGGAFFAAITAISALLKEEKDRTAEFLMTHPVSRTHVILSKLLSTFAIILILNVIVFACSALSILAIGEDIDWKIMLLIHLAYLLMQFEIAGLCFGISAFLSKSGLGIGIGIASMFYFLNIVANISDDAKSLKYITPFGYTESSDIINDKALNTSYIIPGMIIMVIGIVAAFVYYRKKDIKS
ncbi:MAG: ABC transporter permease subunit [Clostridiales bacterium]|nr:ABC transporter permease subunit [Clostridiales bacterium]